MVKHLNNQDFEKIFSMDCYKNINDICQRIKLKNLFSSSDCKNYFKEENNEFVVDIDKIERARSINKITIANPELYFDNLFQIYLSVIQKCKNDKTRLKDIQLIARALYQYIKEYLKKIEKRKFPKKMLK